MPFVAERSHHHKAIQTLRISSDVDHKSRIVECRFGTRKNDKLNNMNAFLRRHRSSKYTSLSYSKDYPEVAEFVKSRNVVEFERRKRFHEIETKSTATNENEKENEELMSSLSTSLNLQYPSKEFQNLSPVIENEGFFRFDESKIVRSPEPNKRQLSTSSSQRRKRMPLSPVGNEEFSLRQSGRKANQYYRTLHYRFKSLSPIVTGSPLVKKRSRKRANSDNGKIMWSHSTCSIGHKKISTRPKVRKLSVKQKRELYNSRPDLMPDRWTARYSRLRHFIISKTWQIELVITESISSIFTMTTNMINNDNLCTCSSHPRHRTRSY